MLDAHQLMWTQIAAGISVLLFGLMLFNLVRMWGRMQAARSWDKVEGIITVSRVDRPATHASDDQNDARPIIRYRYHFGGQELESDKVFVGGIAMTTGVLAEKLAGRYPAGAHVDVHVDPKHPAEALLEPAAAQNVAALVAFTMVFGFIAAILTAHSLAGLRQSWRSAVRVRAADHRARGRRVLRRRVCQDAPACERQPALADRGGQDYPLRRDRGDHRGEER
jgi:hypothetical protein